MKNKLRFFRLMSEKSQDQLAVEAGLSQAQVSRIERGYINPQEKDKKTLSRVLGVNAEALFEKE